MRTLILGADGYLGWPTSMHLANKGHDVLAVDNYTRRTMAMETSSEALFAAPNLSERARLFSEHIGESSGSLEVVIGDCADLDFVCEIVKKFKPECVVHYAEQPSAPYSMRGPREAKYTLENNLGTTFSLIWALMQHAPDCHMVKLGTMGEYGTPNIDIEEGWIDIDHNGRSDKFLFPRQAGSLYHTTKVLDTDLLWFYVRTYGIAVTDLMQGPVYGISTPEADLDDRLLPSFHYDDIFGTVVNRFVAQAVAGVPLTVYGKGGQTRGYLNLNDTLQCVELAISNPADKGELRVLNQFTEQFSVNELAAKVQSVGNQVGLDVQINAVDNPRKEMEDHYYNAKHSGLLDLGLEPNFLTDDVLSKLILKVKQYEASIDQTKILPRVKWS